MDGASAASLSHHWKICPMTTSSTSITDNLSMVSSSKSSPFWPMEAFRLQDTTHTLRLSSLTRSSKMSVRRSGSNLTDRLLWRVERLARRMNTSSDNTSLKGHQMWVLHATWVVSAQLGSTLGSAYTICSTGLPAWPPWKPLQICPTRQVHLQVTRKNRSIWEGLTLDITSRIQRKKSRTKFCTNSNLTHCVSSHFTKVPKNKDPAAPITIITEAWV